MRILGEGGGMPRIHVDYVYPNPKKIASGTNVTFGGPIKTEGSRST